MIYIVNIVNKNPNEYILNHLCLMSFVIWPVVMFFFLETLRFSYKSTRLVSFKPKKYEKN